MNLLPVHFPLELAKSTTQAHNLGEIKYLLELFDEN